MNQTVEKRLDGASVGDWIRNNTNLLLMFALIIVGALTSDNFFSMDNILNVLRRITVNGKVARASYDVKVGDVIALHFGERVLAVEVLDVSETAGKSEASLLYREVNAQ